MFLNAHLKIQKWFAITEWILDFALKASQGALGRDWLGEGLNFCQNYLDIEKFCLSNCSEKMHLLFPLHIISYGNKTWFEFGFKTGTIVSVKNM